LGKSVQEVKQSLKEGSVEFKKYLVLENNFKHLVTRFEECQRVNKEDKKETNKKFREVAKIFVDWLLRACGAFLVGYLLWKIKTGEL
jgi:hypothetical protein